MTARARLGLAFLGAALLSSPWIGAAGAQDRGRTAGAPFYANTFEKMPAAAALTALGRELFLDPALSASGKIACTGCHDPKHAFGPANGLPVQRGGGDGRSFGMRAVRRSCQKYLRRLVSRGKSCAARGFGFSLLRRRRAC